MSKGSVLFVQTDKCYKRQIEGHVSHRRGQKRGKALNMCVCKGKRHMQTAYEHVEGPRCLSVSTDGIIFEDRLLKPHSATGLTKSETRGKHNIITTFP